MAISWNSRIVLYKEEATYGVDAAPTGAANAMLVTNLSIQAMEGQDVSRELDLPWLAAQETIPADLHANVSFRVELVPSGTAGVAPAWASLIRSMAAAQVIDPGPPASTAYNPASDNHASGTFHVWIGGTRWAVTGTRGTGDLRFTASGIPYLECQMRGLFNVASEQARPTIDISAFIAPELVEDGKTTFTIDGNPFVMRQAALSLGNQVENRFLVGSRSILITGRAETLTATVEAVPTTTFNPWAVAMARTRLPVVITHGTAAGRTLSLAIPSAQLIRPSALENQQNILEWPLSFTPLPVAGNDQWTLTLT